MNRTDHLEQLGVGYVVVNVSTGGVLGTIYETENQAQGHITAVLEAKVREAHIQNRTPNSVDHNVDHLEVWRVSRRTRTRTRVCVTALVDFE